MLLNRKLYFIKERAGLMKLADTYDIFDPDTEKQIGIAKERPGGLIHVLRLVISKQLLPTRIDIHEEDENRPPVLSIKRGFTFLRSKIHVVDHEGKNLGYFKSKLFSLGGGFFVYDNDDNVVAEVKGDWKGWNFKFHHSDGTELGTISKKWAGLAKEFFTSADNYVIALNDKSEDHHSALMLAAGLAIDCVFKEKG